MRTVHKFLLAPVGHKQPVMLPVGAHYLRIDNKYGSPYLWALVDTSLPFTTQHEFLVLGTGDPVPDGFWPVNSFFEHQGNAMEWHGFARLPGGAHV